jgi:hypothetical protein
MNKEKKIDQTDFVVWIGDSGNLCKNDTKPPTTDAIIMSNSPYNDAQLSRPY